MPSRVRGSTPPTVWQCGSSSLDAPPARAPAGWGRRIQTETNTRSMPSTNGRSMRQLFGGPVAVALELTKGPLVVKIALPELARHRKVVLA